jgi:tRNA(Ile)-lysidine synthase TilS/MesJ
LLEVPAPKDWDAAVVAPVVIQQARSAKMQPSIEARVRQTIARHGMLTNASPQKQRVGVAVSGGTDSVCLFLLMCPLADVSILHLNHLLHGEESFADDAFVRGLVARFDVVWSK